MTKTSILNIKGEKTKDITLAKEVFEVEGNDVALYDAIVLARANQRQGSHKVKNRAEVSGGGRKPWAQKGTGNARQGSIRAPQWYHGGVAFGPKVERNYTKKQNKKESILALRTALTYKAKDKNLVVIENFNLKSNKTNEALEIIEALKLEGKLLLVVEELNENVILATRNIKNLKLIAADEINTLDVVSADKLVVTEKALEKIEEVLK